MFRIETITRESNMEMRAMVKLIPITIDTSDNGKAGVNFFSSISKIEILVTFAFFRKIEAVGK